MAPLHMSRMKKPVGFPNRHQILMAASANHLVSAMATLVGANNTYGAEDLRSRQMLVDRTFNPCYYPLNPNSDADILNTRYQNWNADVATRTANRNAMQEGDIHNAYAMPGDPGADPADPERIDASNPPVPRQPGKPYGGQGYQLGPYLGQMGDPMGRRLGSHRHEMAGIAGKGYMDDGGQAGGGGSSDGSSTGFEDPEDVLRGDPTQGQNQAAAMEHVAERQGGHAGRQEAQYPGASAPPMPDPDGIHAHAESTGESHEDQFRRHMEALHRHHANTREAERTGLEHREELARSAHEAALRHDLAATEYNATIHTELMNRHNEIARREREAAEREVTDSAARTRDLNAEIAKNEEEIARRQAERNVDEREIHEARARYDEAKRAVDEHEAAVRASIRGRQGASDGAVRREVLRREEMDRAHLPHVHGVGRDAQVMDHTREYTQAGRSRARATREAVMGAHGRSLPGDHVHEAHVFEERHVPEVPVVARPIPVPLPIPPILRPQHVGEDVAGDVQYLYERRWVIGGPDARANMDRARAAEREGRRLQVRGYAHAPPVARREAYDRAEHRREAAGARQNDRRGRYAPRTDMEERRRVPPPRAVVQDEEVDDPHAHMTAKERRARRRELNRQTLDVRQPGIQRRKRARETQEAMRPSTRAQRRRGA